MRDHQVVIVTPDLERIDADNDIAFAALFRGVIETQPDREADGGVGRHWSQIV